MSFLFLWFQVKPITLYVIIISVPSFPIPSFIVLRYDVETCARRPVQISNNIENNTTFLYYQTYRFGLFRQDFSLLFNFIDHQSCALNIPVISLYRGHDGI